MRGILIIAILVLGMALLGWITFGGSDNRPSINLEKQKIEEDTRELVDEGRELVDKSKRELERAGTELSEPEGPEDPGR